MATNIDLYKRFLNEVRKSHVGSVPPESFLQWANKAVRIVVDNKLAMMEANTRHTDDLLPLHKVGVELAEITGLPPKPEFELPSDYLRTDSIHVKLTKDNVSTDNVRCVFLRSNRVSSVLSSAYDAPSLRQCYFSYTLSGTKKAVHFFCPSGYTIKAFLTYYKEPALITYSETPTTLEWNDSMVNEIVDMACTRYLASIADQRVQTQVALKQQTNTNL